MRKHPVIFGMALLIAAGLLFYLLFFGIGTHSGKSKSFSSNNKIGVVNIYGIITSSDEIVEQLEGFGRDDSIAAIVVRIDSPGGGVAASQEIYDAIVDLKKNKKVVASMGSIAASGGLLIACAADKIVANPGTVTGSISAVMQFANFEELLKKIGFKSSVVKSGKFKDIGSPFRDMTPDEEKIIQDLVDDIFHQFIDVIVESRKISREQVAFIADGRIFSGRKAKEYGLVDILGDMSSAARLATTLAGKEGKYDLIYPKEKRLTLLDWLLQSALQQLSIPIKERIDSFYGAGYIYLP